MSKTVHLKNKVFPEMRILKDHGNKEQHHTVINLIYSDTFIYFR